MSDDPLESSIIHHLLQGRRRPHPQLEVDVGDDAAVLPDGTVLTKDVLVEGVHFDHKVSPEALGWKTVAVNVSDIGAMGGIPRWALLGVSLPQNTSARWIEDFARGLHSALNHWRVDLIGGDTTASPGPILISLSVMGQCERALRRDQARAGDHIWVTGTLGDAAQGFFHGGDALRSLHRPQPPVEFGSALATLPGVHAMMDISDGLDQDLHRLCAASNVGAVVHPHALPAAEGLSPGPDRVSLQVAFGEDYQLLFTAKPESEPSLIQLAQAHDLRLSRIGRIQEKRDVELQGQPWPPSLFEHFHARAHS